MADVMLTCPVCGKQTPVSEYVAARTIPCGACGRELPVPARSRPADGALKLRPAGTTSAATPAAAGPDAGAGRALPIAAIVQPSGARGGRRRRRAPSTRAIQALSWLVFIALAAALIFIRFRLGLAGAELATLKTAGMLAVGAAYLVIIAVAVKDNMFDGLLCLVVPLYPFYYLFLISGAVFLRAVMAGLLAGFGWDCLLFLNDVWLKIFHGVNYWIQHV